MAAGASGKAPAAYRTIGEVARETGVAPHVLRYWEARFPELRPLTRAGKRRYYAPDDVALIRRIQAMLSAEGLTMRGARQRLGGGAAAADDGVGADRTGLTRVRALLQSALDESGR